MSAADLMAKVLGADGFPFVVIPHPISSATSDELGRAAAHTAAECVAVLTGRPFGD